MDQRINIDESTPECPFHDKNMWELQDDVKGTDVMEINQSVKSPKVEKTWNRVEPSEESTKLSSTVLFHENTE